MLTVREREILELLRGGLSQREIARRLGLSHATVRGHAHNLYRKLGVSSAAQAVASADPEPLPPFTGAYLDALDRHLADGSDRAAERDLVLAGAGLTGRPLRRRDRDVFLDRVLDALGVTNGR